MIQQPSAPAKSSHCVRPPDFYMLHVMPWDFRAWRVALAGWSCAAVWLAGAGGAVVQGAVEASAASDATNAAPATETRTPALMDVAALPFPVGEAITYRIYWGVVPVGQARVVIERVEEHGRPLLAIRSTARTNRLLEKFYPVDDLLESLITGRMKSPPLTMHSAERIMNPRSPAPSRITRSMPIRATSFP